MRNIANISIIYWLDAIKAVSRAENCGGMGLEKVIRVLRSTWKVLILFPPKQQLPCFPATYKLARRLIAYGKDRAMYGQTSLDRTRL